jgi:hypothetical protein
MTAKSNKIPAPLSFWAVARLTDTSQVAIKLNDLPPVLMSLEDAREIATALKLEIASDSRDPVVGLPMQ